MRVNPLTTLAFAAALAGCGGSDKSTAPPGTTTADVYTPGNSFSPFSTVIPIGSAVRFNISGVPHNVIFGKVAGAPADIPVTNNQTVSRTFNTRGTFLYDCTVHPGMSGQVVVQ